MVTGRQEPVVQKHQPETTFLMTIRAESGTVQLVLREAWLEERPATESMGDTSLQEVVGPFEPTPVAPRFQKLLPPGTPDPLQLAWVRHTTESTREELPDARRLVADQAARSFILS